MAHKLKVLGPPFDPNTMYEVHRFGKKDMDLSAKQEYLDFRRKHYVPLWVGEAGENTDAWFDGLPRPWKPTTWAGLSCYLRTWTQP
jgi:hypothetical protein